MSKRSWHIGASLDDCLREEGIPENARVVAIEETLAFHLQNHPAKQSAEKERD